MKKVMLLVMSMVFSNGFAATSPPKPLEYCDDVDKLSTVDLGLSANATTV